jgi:hypothetical protein
MRKFLTGGMLSLLIASSGAASGYPHSLPVSFSGTEDITGYVTPDMSPGSSEPMGTRAVGDAGEGFPFGKVDEALAVTVPLETRGGSMTVRLPRDVTLYIVYQRPGLNVGSLLTVTPYLSMPTRRDATPLGTNYGYGVEIQASASRHGELPVSAYAVFDLDRGQTIANIRRDLRKVAFCDPSLPSFEPQTCAWLNDVPLDYHTNRRFAAVRPVPSTGPGQAMEMQGTLPIGYENLLVVEISSEMTLIPQALTTGLLRELVLGNLTYPNQTWSVEAASRAAQEKLFKPEELNIRNQFVAGAGRSFSELTKMLFAPPDYAKSELEETMRKSGYFDSEKIAREVDPETVIRQRLITSFTLGMDGPMQTELVVPAAAFLRRLERAGFDMTKERQVFMGLLPMALYDYGDFLEGNAPNASDVLLAAVILSAGGMPPRADNTGFDRYPVRSSARPATFNLGGGSPIRFRKVSQGEQAQPPMESEITGGDPSLDGQLADLIANAKKFVAAMCVDEVERPDIEIVKAMQMTQVLNDMSVEEGKCHQKLCKQAKARQKESGDCDRLRFLERSLAFGCPDLNIEEYGSEREILSQWHESADKCFRRKLCTELIERRTLSTFGNNRLQCAEVVDGPVEVR